MYIEKTCFYSDDSVSMDVESESISRINTLPEEILLQIFSYLQLKELSINVALTCRKWCCLSFDSALQFSVILSEFETLLPELDKKISYIGPEALKQHLGEIGEIPALPKELLKELMSPDPQNKEKKKKETHILALIPETILMPKTKSETPLTLNFLNKFKKFEVYWHKIRDDKEYGDKPYPKTSWVLMTKDVLKGSRGKTRDEQLQMASKHGEGYRAPTLLQAAFINTMLFESKEIRLFSNDPWTYICCLDKPIGEPKLVVGGFTPLGFRVYSHYDSSFVGVAALKMF